MQNMQKEQKEQKEEKISKNCTCVPAISTSYLFILKRVEADVGGGKRFIYCSFQNIISLHRYPQKSLSRHKILCFRQSVYLNTKLIQTHKIQMAFLILSGAAIKVAIKLLKLQYLRVASSYADY